MTDNLYLEKIKNLKTKALKIADEFNQYGGGPQEDENAFYYYIQEMEDLITEDIPSHLRREIIEDFMAQYHKRNYGLDDVLRSVVFHTAPNEDEWKLIINELEKTNSLYDREHMW